MSFARDFGKAIRSAVVLWILVCLIYPAIVLIVGQVIFPNQANGSLLTNAQGQVIGSALIGQPFTSDRYFNSRPSTTDYSTANPQKDEDEILRTGLSGASSFAPSNPELIDRIKTAVIRLQQAGIQPTADLVYTSGSSLDPHITPEAARAQMATISAARGLSSNQVEILIEQNTQGRLLGIWGEPGVNVLKLNLALDASQR